MSTCRAARRGRTPSWKGCLLLQKAVGTEKRPLSWVVGPQGVVRPPLPSQRDLKRPERQKETYLRPPDSI